MKFYWIIDDSTTAHALVTETRLDVSTDEDAIRSGELSWGYLTRSEQEKCDDFYVGYARELEAGIPDYDDMDVIYDFKEGKQ